MAMSIQVQDICKRFGTHPALDRVSFAVPAGARFALLGPSGSGKTTLLRVIAGLEAPDAGSVLLENEDASARDARRRDIGFVFQHYALFRHQTVSENVGFALRMRGRPRAEITERVHELLRLVQLEGLGPRYPAQLSGGQRQRVALARALAARPKVLLLDEPFGALDARVRQELRDWLRHLHEAIQVTSIFVTHDQEEALELADRIVVLNQGRVEQVGTPEEVYHHPANSFVMRFLGQVNLFHGRVEAGRVLWTARADGGGGRVVGYVRPHQLDIQRVADRAPNWQAQVTRIHRAGVQVRISLALLDGHQPVEVALSPQRFRELALQPGECVYVQSEHIQVFDEDYCI
jgi:sulfate transport system ATP-binding protein